MFRSMFARLFSVFLVLMLVLIAAIASLSYVTIRNDRINARLDELKSQAREIAYLAWQADYESWSSFGLVSSANQYLEWKEGQLNDEFGALIVVMDRYGTIRHMLYNDQEDNSDIKKTLSGEEFLTVLYQAMSGKEIEIRTNVPGLGGPVFTVAVPWGQGQTVLGAVFIHTRAQVVEAGYQNLLWQVLLGAGIAVLLAGISVFLITRQLTKPLKSMAYAAGEMARGNFDARAKENGVTEMRDLAASFNSMAGQLKRTEESRREFVANVSHELRSPMTSIQGFLEGMQDGTIPPDEHPRYLKIVGDEAKRLTKLIADLLDLSRMEQGEAKPNYQDFDINEMIRRALIRRMSDIDRKLLEVDVDFLKDQCYCWGDSDRIEQVVVNLLDNALKFTPEKGKIAWRTREEGRQVFITLTDNGSGILPQDQPHIFERFYKADKAHTSGKGTGLGLSICRRILEAHGQTIRLLPTERGAAFEFTLEKGKEKAGRDMPEQEEETP
jgi:signal transduction histidine kinase